MKDGKFEVGDKVICTESCDNRLTKGKEYLIVKNPYVFVIDNNGRASDGFIPSRFKLADTPEDFTYEYFSALNEKDAEVYIGRTMEFADPEQVRNDTWFRGVFKGLNQLDSPYTEDSFRVERTDHGNFLWQFARTCPETFVKKLVPKPVQCWAAMFKEGGYAGFYAGKSGAEKAWPGLDYVKLTGEYEVEE